MSSPADISSSPLVARHIQTCDACQVVYKKLDAKGIGLLNYVVSDRRVQKLIKAHLVTDPRHGRGFVQVMTNTFAAAIDPYRGSETLKLCEKIAFHITPDQRVCCTIS